MSEQNEPTASKFESILQADVPRGREGKHRQIVQHLIEAIEGLDDGSALKVSLAGLPDSKENIRSALSRATKQRNMAIATSSDDDFLYVWKTKQDETGD